MNVAQNQEGSDCVLCYNCSQVDKQMRSTKHSTTNAMIHSSQKDLSIGRMFVLPSGNMRPQHIAAVQAMPTSQRDVAEMLSKEYVVQRKHSMDKC